jgi:hypothetical protein
VALKDKEVVLYVLLACVYYNRILISCIFYAK